MEKRLSHPKGLWIIATIGALGSAGLGMLNSLLILLLTQKLHVETSLAYKVSATFNSLVFTLPLVGGYLAEKLGYQRTLLLGLVICISGLISASFVTSFSTSLSLALYALGLGFYVPSYLVLQGKLYAKDDARRESAYTWSYLIMNIGFLAPIASSGYLVRYFGFSTAMIAAAVIVSLAFIVYFLGRHLIVPHGERTISAQLNWNPVWAWLTLLVAAAVFVAIGTAMVINVRANADIIFSLITLVSLWVVWAAFQQKSSSARYRLLAFLILSIISVGFWALYTLEPSLMTVFIRDNVDRNLAGYTIPPSTYYSLDALFIILLGGLYSQAWKKLSQHNKNPSLPAKFSASLVAMSTAFFLLAAAIYFHHFQGLINMLWIVLAYFLFASGELFIGPIGQSMVGRLSPEGMEGRLMGTWQLYSGFGSFLAGYLAQLAVIPKSVSMEMSNRIYATGFLKIGLTTFALAIIAMILTPFIRRLSK